MPAAHSGNSFFAPLAQSFIVLFGWMGAMWSFAAITLAAIPIGRALRAEPVSSQAAAAIHAREPGLKAALQDALANRSYLLLHAGFYTCGFHIAFLVTHLPGEVQLCGLPADVASWSIAIIGLANIAGSLLAGWGVQHFRSKYLLSGIYASRAMMIAIYLPAPKTPITFYVFAAGLGLTWLSTVPPTVSVVGKLFGTRHLATLFGLTLLSHQIGGFFGAWVGGIVVVRSGTYDSMWYADIALAASAALLNLPIREPRMAAALEPA